MQLFERANSYMIDVSNGFSRRAPHVFHMIIGGQRRPFGPGLTRIEPELGVIAPTRVGTAAVHRTRAAVLQAAPYPQGGIHGGHVVVLWNERGRGYLVSAHGSRMARRAVIEAALDVARASDRARTSAAS